MVYTAQTLGCSAGNCLMQAPVCMHFPGLSRPGSVSRVLHKGADLLGPAFCARPRSEQLRWPGAWRASSPSVEGCGLSSPQFQPLSLGYTGAPSQFCRVFSSGELISGCDPPGGCQSYSSPEVLVSNEVCLQFGLGRLSGAAIARFRLWLPPPACQRQAMGQSTAG